MRFDEMVGLVERSGRIERLDEGFGDAMASMAGALGSLAGGVVSFTLDVLRHAAGMYERKVDSWGREFRTTKERIERERRREEIEARRKGELDKAEEAKARKADEARLHNEAVMAFVKSFNEEKAELEKFKAGLAKGYSWTMDRVMEKMRAIDDGEEPIEPGPAPGGPGEGGPGSGRTPPPSSPAGDAPGGSSSEAAGGGSTIKGKNRKSGARTAGRSSNPPPSAPEGRSTADGNVVNRALQSKAMKGIQFVLDLAGVDPGPVGMTADGLNAAISLARAAVEKDPDERKRQLLDASLSVVSLIPMADLVKLLKLRKLRPVAKAVVKGTRAARKIASDAKAAKAAKAVSDLTGGA